MASSRTKREIKIRFKRESRVFENDALESRVIIGEASLIEVFHEDGMPVERTTDTIVIKGEAAEGAFTYGLEYRLFGKWFQHHLYGDQFHYESFVIDKPATRDAVIAYLKQCRGFGSVRAGMLFDTYGESCIDVLIQQPERVASEIRGLKLENAKEAAELLSKTEHIRKAKLELIGVLNGKGFPKKTVESLLRDYSSEAAESVRRNPYLLMRYRGCGFLKTDKLYIELGHDPKRLKRQSLCAWHAIAKVSEGDTWFPKSQAVRAIRENVAGTESRIDRAITLSLKADMLRVREGEMGTQWIAESKKAMHEERVARLIITACAEARGFPELVQWPAVASLNVDDHQREKLAESLHGFICVLGGGPGTGKTHCSAEIIKRIIETHGPDHIAACAPTGKAAVRMGEAFSKAGVELRATTIHSLLNVMVLDGGMSFAYNESNPLPLKFIIADEESMCDVQLFGSLLAARGFGCHVLLIGDTHQLSPVGHGAPLRDVIEAGMPTGILTEIRRNSGRIVQACKEIRDKRRFDPSPELNITEGENLVILEPAACDTQDEFVEAQLDLMRGLIEKLKGSEKYDPVWDVQVVCPVNKKSSPLNRSALNKRIQDQLNLNGKSAAGNPFRVGDKVICLKNGQYEPAVKQRIVRGRWLNDDPGDSCEGFIDRWIDDPDGPCTRTEPVTRQYVANGEQGEVLSVDTSRFVVRLANPDREIIVFRSTKRDDDDSDSSADSSGDSDDSRSGNGCDWDLGYATSVHKSQGSEWPVVIVMLDDSGAAKQTCSRNWIYTAISRAKTMCLMIGKKTRAMEMCRRDGLQRKTFLKELILEGMNSAGVSWPRRADPTDDSAGQGNSDGSNSSEFIWTDEIVGELLEAIR